MKGDTSRSWDEFHEKSIEFERKPLDFEKRSPENLWPPDAEKRRLLYDMIPDGEWRNTPLELVNCSEYSRVRELLQPLIARGRSEETHRRGRDKDGRFIHRVDNEEERGAMQGKPL